MAQRIESYRDLEVYKLAFELQQKRRYQSHFVSKLTDADGEQAETQHWIETAKACDYLDEATTDRLMSKCMSVGKMLGSMMSKTEKLCPSNR